MAQWVFPSVRLLDARLARTMQSARSWANRATNLASQMRDLNTFIGDLRRLAKVQEAAGLDATASTYARAANEIERLREQVETWKDRYEAERAAHEATMKAWDEEWSGL